MTIQAVLLTEAGGPEILTRREAPAPTPGPGELVVKTAATGVNFIEIYQRSGVYDIEHPFALGSEGAGEVIAVGDGVTDFRVGDRVASAEATGTYSEQFVVPAEKAVHVPAGISLETAAAIPLQGLTAHYLATSAASVQAGEVVLVHAGAGGVGLLLTQLLVKNRGAIVITTASTEEKRQLSLDAGAQHSIPYEGFSDRVRDLTSGEGVGVVYDGVGKATFDGSLDALRVRGSFVLFGGASGQVPLFDLQRLNSGGSLSITRPSLGHFLLNPTERSNRYSDLFEAVAAGTLDFRIGRSFAAHEASEAHRALDGRETTGKVILTH